MSITSHLAHTTSLRIARIGKVSENQRVICLILIYNVPRTGQPSLLQKQTLPGTACPQMAPVPSQSHACGSRTDLGHQQPFPRSCWPPNHLGSLHKRRSDTCNWPACNCFSPSKYTAGFRSSSRQTSWVHMFSKKANETN